MKKVLRFAAGLLSAISLFALVALPSLAFAQMTCEGNLCPYLVNENGTLPAAFFAIFFTVWSALMIFFCITFWKIYVKAGQPGWKIFIPYYNAVIMLRMSGMSGWWILLLFVPIANFILAIVMMAALARAFGRSGGFAVGLFFLPIVFFPILAFGSSRYVGPYYAPKKDVPPATPSTPTTPPASEMPTTPQVSA